MFSHLKIREREHTLTHSSHTEHSHDLNSVTGKSSKTQILIFAEYSQKVCVKIRLSYHFLTNAHTNEHTGQHKLHFTDGEFLREKSQHKANES